VKPNIVRYKKSTAIGHIIELFVPVRQFVGATNENSDINITGISTLIE
jgi:hypothetical protein